jgi:recombination protein RecR
MDAYTESMERLIAALGELPGIGRRSAERMAFYLLDADADEVEAFAQALHDIKTKVGRCVECGSMAEGDRCAICLNPRRDRSRLCVVEKPKDVLRLEATGGYNGLYHVLGGLLAPMEGRGPEQLDVARLLARILRPTPGPVAGAVSGGEASVEVEPGDVRVGGSAPVGSTVGAGAVDAGEDVDTADIAPAGEVEEVILALSPTVEGDGTALYLVDRLKTAGVRVTRLARGLPTGANFDYANPGMLADAIRGRQSMSDAEE